jgi:hypothetical protein
LFSSFRPSPRKCLHNALKRPIPVHRFPFIGHKFVLLFLIMYTEGDTPSFDNLRRIY